jgi:hypothetical protein
MKGIPGLLISQRFAGVVRPFQKPMNFEKDKVLPV